jgi:hypothetical protein
MAVRALCFEVVEMSGSADLEQTVHPPATSQQDKYTTSLMLSTTRDHSSQSSTPIMYLKGYLAANFKLNKQKTFAVSER